MAYKQAKNRKKKLLKTYHEIESMRKHCTGSGVWYNEDRGFYYKFTASNTPGYAKMLRRISNKKVRKSVDIGNHADYRRSYDYKWSLF
jgi:hypothetical protein